MAGFQNAKMGAGGVVQQVQPWPAVGHPMWVLFRVPAAPLLIKLPAKAPEKAAEDGTGV